MQAERCGALWGRGLLLEAHSSHLPPPSTRSLSVALGGPRGHLIVQTDKPLYAPRQTGECSTSTLKPSLICPQFSPQCPKCSNSPKSTPKFSPKPLQIYHEFPKSTHFHPTFTHLPQIHPQHTPNTPGHPKSPKSPSNSLNP